MLKRQTRRTRSVLALVATPAIVAVSLLATPSSASATTQACNYDNVTFNACLNFDYQGFFWYDASVGIDVYLPEQYGREIIACGANFKASLWGDDGGGSKDDFIRNFVISPGWPSAGPNGIGAELYTLNLNADDLNEDGDDNEDELYAKVSYFDCHTGLTREFRTGTIRGDYRA